MRVRMLSAFHCRGFYRPGSLRQDRQYAFVMFKLALCACHRRALITAVELR